ncbi:MULTISPECIES: signal recognition particle-docking protein FtsY [unclassified Brachybacterium]|uniref:signal recognition particle-docking protein FtsY n=1 Tax=unclassified Brachybacterium TaxID=2623841 RepID=UPI00403315B3
MDDAAGRGSAQASEHSAQASEPVTGTSAAAGTVAPEGAQSVDEHAADPAVGTSAAPETAAGAPETAADAPEPAASAAEVGATDVPVTDAPVSAAPATEAPVTEAPVTEAPATEAPVATPASVSAPETAAGRPELDTPEPPADRMVRLRDRLSRSGAIGRGILGLLTRGGAVDEDTWDEIEETLLLADLGPDATDEMLENLRRRIQVLGTDDAAGVREVLREELVGLIDPDLDRRLAASRRDAPDGTEVPSVLLMVGVNGTGKTTTVGKLARVLVAADRTVVLGAADTFRAAAADQLQTWGSRVGVDTVRADRDGADPAAVAFDAVKEGIEQEVDVVIIDTAGRLQNKKGLMDELGKVRRVAEKGLHGDSVAEVLLVIDATTGQNGMQQAKVFSEAVNITGIVLTKLDGTAKGGIVVNVQRALGVPVKMVGLGEGMDDLTPFDPYGFVDALLED